jgi:hypothetical protein
MKKLFAFLMIAGFLTGCSGLQLNSDVATLTAIQLGGYNLGYYVGQSKTTADDQAIADAYALARTGTLTPAQMAAAFAKFKLDNAQLAGSLFIIMQNMGATINAEGGLVSLSGIPVVYWDKAAEGYVAGYEMGKLNQKAVGSKVSAVKAKMPKK